MKRRKSKSDITHTEITNYKYQDSTHVTYSNSDDNSYIIHASISVTKTVNDKELEPIVLPNIDNCTRYCEYKIIGKNPATNRRKSDYVVAKVNDPEDIITSKTYLLEPYTIERIFKRPTARQLEYAKDLDIPIPSNCSSSDISCLISRFHEDRDADYISSGLIDFAAENNVLISPYSSVIYGVCAIINNLYDSHLLAFFIYVIYCVQNDIAIENFNKLTNKSIFYGLSSSEKYNDLVNFVCSIDTIEKYRYLFAQKRINCSGSAKKLELYNVICDYITKRIK